MQPTKKNRQREKWWEQQCDDPDELYRQMKDLGRDLMIL